MTTEVLTLSRIVVDRETWTRALALGVEYYLNARTLVSESDDPDRPAWAVRDFGKPGTEPLWEKGYTVARVLRQRSGAAPEGLILCEADVEFS